jgi:hypothetical protein
MNENQPLLGKIKTTVEGTHQMPIDRLYFKLSTSADGLTTSQAKQKRHAVGLNFVKPPITAPAWLCCLLPCLLSTTSMKKYNECVPDYGYVKRNGKWVKLDATSIVPGDVIRVGRDERVPADLRIFKVIQFELFVLFCIHSYNQATSCVFDGSAIMGKSEPILCDPDRFAEEYLDSPNIAFLGYLCIEGISIEKRFISFLG